MNFLDLFSGIGGFRLGLEMAGHECIGHVEIDKYANQSYRAIHQPKESEFFREDITTITDESIRGLRDRGIDIIAGGFPCQAFSIAGARKGFEDTRGTLFFDIARMARILRPKYLLLENVKGLLSHDNGDTFEIILRTLDEIGYDAEWQVLNSKHFGVPQNRERVFIIGHLRGERTRKVFPVRSDDEKINELSRQQTTTNTLTARYEGVGNGSYVVEGEQYAQKIDQIGNLIDTDSFGGNPERGRVYGIDGISPCLNTMGGGGLEPKVAIPVLTPDRAEKRQNGRRFKEDGEPMFTLTAQGRHGIMVTRNEIKSKTETSHCLMARDYKGIGNQEMTAVLEIKEETKQGVAILRPKRTEYGKAIRKDYEAGKVDESRHNMTKLEPVFDGVSNTITTVQKDNLLLDNQQCMRIRKLTPKECWRLQGFPDWAFERAKAAGVSDSQLYKQAGNSVTVNVVYEIAKGLK